MFESLSQSQSIVNGQHVGRTTVQSLYGEERLSEERVRNVQAGLGRVGAVFHFESVSKVERVLAIINAGTLMCLKP